MANFWCLLCLCVWCFMSVVVKAESVNTLLSIASDLGYSGWKGTEPPCDWYGVDCIEGRIIGITLVAENLTGVISPRFADIRSLRLIDLSHNRLRGTIPSELTRLNLASLDLSYNQLHGKVPPFKATVVELQGNPGIETKTQGNVRGLLIGIIVLGVVLIGVVCLAVYREMRSRRSESDPTLDKVVEVENKAFPFEILREATEDFGDHKVLGRGGFGTVDKGRLPDGTEIA